jgi:hypothetical protein
LSLERIRVVLQRSSFSSSSQSALEVEPSLLRLAQD